MTPLQIQMMLHFYAICEPYRGSGAGSEPCNSAICSFEDAGLIERSEWGWRTTKGGDVYVEALKAVPLPVQVWVIPKSSDA